MRAKEEDDLQFFRIISDLFVEFLDLISKSRLYCYIV